MEREDKTDEYQSLPSEGRQETVAEDIKSSRSKNPSSMISRISGMLGNDRGSISAGPTVEQIKPIAFISKKEYIDLLKKESLRIELRLDLHDVYKIKFNVDPSDDDVNLKTNVLLPTGKHIRFDSHGVDYSHGDILIPYPVFYRKKLKSIIMPPINEWLNSTALDDITSNEKPSIDSVREKALLLFNRLYKPTEVQFSLTSSITVQTLNMETYETPYGVHIKSCSFLSSFNENIVLNIGVGDLIETVNGISIGSSEQLSSLIRSSNEDVEVFAFKLLRKCPISVSERCHCHSAKESLVELNLFEFGSLLACNGTGKLPRFECSFCQTPHGCADHKLYFCEICYFMICDQCIAQLNSKLLQTGLKPRDLGNIPPWINQVEESFLPSGVGLDHDLSDLGKRLKIFVKGGGLKTSAWWLGEVRDYAPGIGHTIVYEDQTTTGQINLHKETINNFNTREFVLLKSSITSCPDMVRHKTEYISSETGFYEKEQTI